MPSQTVHLNALKYDLPACGTRSSLFMPLLTTAPEAVTCLRCTETLRFKMVVGAQEDAKALAQAQDDYDPDAEDDYDAVRRRMKGM